MNEAKPEDISSYKKWLKNKHDIQITTKTETHYQSVAKKIFSDFEASSFWLLLIKKLNRISQEYHLQTKYNLFAGNPPPKLHIKPFSSLLLNSRVPCFPHKSKLSDQPNALIS